MTEQIPYQALILVDSMPRCICLITPQTKRADLEGVKQMLLDLASEAERGNEKPRGTAEVRDYPA